MRNRFKCFAPTADEHNLRTFQREAASGSGADTRTGAGDDDDLAARAFEAFDIHSRCRAA